MPVGCASSSSTSRPSSTGPPEAQLGRERTDLLAGLLVEQPGVAVPLEEAAAVVTALDLLAEVGRLDGGVADHAGALPAPDHPGEGTQPLGQVHIEVEHSGIVAWGREPAPRQDHLRRRGAGALLAGRHRGRHRGRGGRGGELWLTGEAT